jgi:hypothetical protein
MTGSATRSPSLAYDFEQMNKSCGNPNYFGDRQAPFSAPPPRGGMDAHLPDGDALEPSPR